MSPAQTLRLLARIVTDRPMDCGKCRRYDREEAGVGCKLEAKCLEERRALREFAASKEARK
jgi:hypothetical protein